MAFMLVLGVCGIAMGSTGCEGIPEYSGAAYINIGNGIPSFTSDEKRCTTPFEKYSELDSLGRCGVAYANICKELMPTEERGSIGMIKPSGWHTVKYNKLVDGNYLYNRCHLIGYQLAGENANERNLITGTRYLNKISMLEIENTVAGYINETGNHVLYRVTPRFEGTNLVASGVQIEAWSVEDSGKGVCFNVYCYNVQPGIDIDYATGDSRISADNNAAEEASVSDIQETESAETKESSANASELLVSKEYVLNKNSMRIHLPECSSVADMAEYNKKFVTDTLEDLMAVGYIPCGNCLSSYRQ